MIDNSTVSRILDAAKIEEVVSDFVALKKRGVNYLGLCPFHNEKTGSFTVSPAKNICKCFGCGKGGTPVSFIMEHEHLSYVDALRYLAKKYNIEIVEKEQTDEDKMRQNERESMFALNEFAQKLFSNTLHSHDDGKAIGLSYFNHRGIRVETIKKFGLGYSLDKYDWLSNEAIAKGYKPNFLVKNGLSILREEKNQLFDRYRGRVMFPIHSISGKVVGFGGRTLKQDDAAKYVNSPDSEIYNKSNELYGLYLAKSAIIKDGAILVEGYLDVISMHQSGIENVIASSGTALTQGQIRLIHRFTKSVTIMYDSDNAGVKATLKAINLLLDEGLDIKIVHLPEGDDPDSFAQKHSSTEVKSYIEQNSISFLHFKYNLMVNACKNDPLKRATYISDIISSISYIEDAIVRAEYIKMASSLLEIDEKIVIDQTNKAISEHIEQKKKEHVQQRNREARNAAIDVVPTTHIATSEYFDDVPPPPPSEYDYYFGENEDYAPDNTLKITKKYYAIEERNILYFLVRYGEEEIIISRFEDGQGEIKELQTVAQFILHNLNIDGIIFEDELHQEFINLLNGQVNNPNFKASSFYTQHINQQVSLLAAELLQDKYIVSTIYDEKTDSLNEEAIEKVKARQKKAHQEWLSNAVPKVILEYKNRLVDAMIDPLKKQLKTATENREDITEIMHQLSHLLKIKQALAKLLGDRVILH